jgi:anti-sigma factor RsiW
MKYDRDTEDVLKRYLLGWLEPEEQERLEKQLLTNDEYFEELLAAEDELIDSYVRGDLSEPERESFAQHFLAASERRQKLSFAETLHRYVKVASVAEVQPATVNGRRPPVWKRLMPASLHTQKPLLGLSLAAALVIVIFGASWLIVKNVWLRDQSREEPNAATLAITLRPGLERDTGEIKRVTIAAGLSTVQLQLELSRDEYQSYHAVLQTDDGREVLSADKLKPESLANGRVVTLSLRASRLVRGDYQINLSGLDPGGRFEEIGKYHFRVIATPSQP